MTGHRPFANLLVRNVERKFFKAPTLSQFDITSYERYGKRYYLIASEEHGCCGLKTYKSVTTIIDEKSDKSWLDRWINRIGQEEADAIMNMAKHRGQAIHEMAEAYLRNKDYWYGQGTINVVDFNRVVPLLNQNVSNIYGIELSVYSHRLRTAGRMDLLCQWDGINSVVDFKTARREKLREQVTNYFIQAATYAMMAQEIYEFDIPQICVIILEDGHSEAKVFIEKVADWKSKVEEYFID